MAEVKLYIMDGRVNDTKKTLSLETIVQARITSPAEDIINPVLELDSRYAGYTYVLFNSRYYFINKKEQLLDNRIRLYLTEDVLSTWYHSCEVSGVITKSSTGYTMDLKQDFPKQVNKGIKRITFDDMKDNLGSTIIAQSTYNYATPVQPTQGGE